MVGVAHRESNRLRVSISLPRAVLQRNLVADAEFVRAFDAAWTQATAPDPTLFNVAVMDRELEALRDRNGGWGGTKAAGMAVPVASFRSRSPYIKALPPATRAALDTLGGWLFKVLPSPFTAEGTRANPLPTMAVLHTLNLHLERRNARRVRPCCSGPACVALTHWLTFFFLCDGGGDVFDTQRSLEFVRERTEEEKGKKKEEKKKDKPASRRTGAERRRRRRAHDAQVAAAAAAAEASDAVRHRVCPVRARSANLT